MNAAIIAQKLNGRRQADNWLCHCPAHEDRTPSLSIRNSENGKLLVYCFAGCDSRKIFKVLKDLGISLEDSQTCYPSYPHSYIPLDKCLKERREHAYRIWNEAVNAVGTPVEAYLASRGYNGSIPVTLRFHPQLKHPATGKIVCGMVAAVTTIPDTGLIGIQRTFLLQDGSRKISENPSRAMLGAVKGGAVHLGSTAETVVIAEGIETALSVQFVSKIPSWAALSAKGIESLVLPPMPTAANIIIAADNDSSGTGLRAAKKASQRWVAEGRQVRIIMPNLVGYDFNDLLKNGECIVI